MESFSEFLTEAGPRIKRVRLRIRNGKVQRNIRVSNVTGFTLRGGKMKRMSSSERLHRRRGALRGRFKRRSKMARTLMKRQRSMRRRHAMGL